MGKRSKILVASIQIMLAIAVALFSFDFGDRIMMYMYTEITGYLPPYAGLPEIYNAVGLLLAGAIPALFAYIILYRVPHKSVIVIAIVFLLVVFYFAYAYKSWGQKLSIYYIRYEIVLGGLFIVAIYEIVRKLMASNKSFKSTSKDGAI